MSYQDEWVKGVVRKGYRECERRYEIVKAVCSKLPRHFTVCDIGANLCYFGIRLAEDFPGADITAFESHPAAYAKAQELLEQNGTTRVDLRRKRLRLADLDVMARQGFDVVLALSVLHHVAGSPAKWLEKLERLASVVIVEAAGQDSHRRAARAFRMPKHAIKLGEAPSHLADDMRPIFMLNGGRS